MALYPNSRYMSRSPGRHFGVAPGLDVYLRNRGDARDRFVSDVYSKVLGAVPTGYGSGAWVMAITAGGISGQSGVAIASTGSGVLGLPGTGGASITLTFADASGQLISSGSGAAALSIALNNALLTASLNGSGTATLTITPNAPVLGAKADLTASASLQITGTLQPYAVGQMTGSTVDTSVLTVDAIASAVWEALAAQHTNSATMGGKLNTASSGGVDLNALAQSVWQYATRSLSGEQATQLSEVWKLQGLDPAAPLNVTPSSRSAGSISQNITGDGVTNTTVTRT